MPLPDDVAAELDRRLGPVDAARALATVVLRGLDCGALDEAEVRAATGVDRAVLDGLAGRAPRIDPPTAAAGPRRPTIPS